MVGETGVEPATSSTRTTRATRLRYSPIGIKNRCSESLAGGPEQRRKEPTWTLRVMSYHVAPRRQSTAWRRYAWGSAPTRLLIAIRDCASDTTPRTPQEKMVGADGFKPSTTHFQSADAIRLHHTPMITVDTKSRCAGSACVADPAQRLHTACSTESEPAFHPPNMPVQRGNRLGREDHAIVQVLADE